MQETLKTVLALDGDNTVTLSLPDPKADITLASVQTVFADVIAKELICVNGTPVTRLNKAYIHKVEDVDLV